MKSMTTSSRSRSLSWRAISSAASRLVCSAVCSISPPLVARAELISIEISASVGSSTTIRLRGGAPRAESRLDLALDLKAIE